MAGSDSRGRCNASAAGGFVASGGEQVGVQVEVVLSLEQAEALVDGLAIDGFTFVQFPPPY